MSGDIFGDASASHAGDSVSKAQRTHDGYLNPPSPAPQKQVCKKSANWLWRGTIRRCPTKKVKDLKSAAAFAFQTIQDRVRGKWVAKTLKGAKVHFAGSFGLKTRLCFGSCFFEAYSTQCTSLLRNPFSGGFYLEVGEDCGSSCCSLRRQSESQHAEQRRRGKLCIKMCDTTNAGHSWEKQCHLAIQERRSGCTENDVSGHLRPGAEKNENHHLKKEKKRRSQSVAA